MRLEQVEGRIIEPSNTLKETFRKTLGTIHPERLTERWRKTTDITKRIIIWSGLGGGLCLGVLGWATNSFGLFSASLIPLSFSSFAIINSPDLQD